MQEQPPGADGEMVATEAFRFTHHPSNLGALGFLLLFPRAAANHAALAALVTLHVVLAPCE